MPLPLNSDSESKERAARLLLKDRVALYGFVRACLGNHHDAEDILQEVGVVVIRKSDQFTRETFHAFAIGIATNLVRACLRRRRKSGLFDPEVIDKLEAASARVARFASCDQRRAVLQSCLEQLPEESREVVSRYYRLSDSCTPVPNTVGKISEAIGKSIDAVYRILRNARAQLRECGERKLRKEPM